MIIKKVGFMCDTGDGLLLKKKLGLMLYFYEVKI